MRLFPHTLLMVWALLAGGSAAAQDILNRIPRGGGGSGGGGGDSLQRRDRSADSITLTVYYLDSVRGTRLDTSISDAGLRFYIPPTHRYLGNLGAPTRSYLFEPRLQAGFDYGLHALDVYRFTPQTARFFNTTRPYTELVYALGSQTQQAIEVIHTQNVRPSWNLAFHYRLITSPGFFKNSKTNHNNLQLTSWYASPNKRYNHYVILQGSKLQAAENGGIQADSLLDDPIYSERFSVPVKLGNDILFGRDFFSSNITLGNKYKFTDYLLRQQYDFGRKDSLVTDSTVIPLFYPRFRFEHTFHFQKADFRFEDVSNGDINHTYDPEPYTTYFGFAPRRRDSLGLIRQDSWRKAGNDFSIYSYPDPKNLRQFLKVGATYDQYWGTLVDSLRSRLYNIWLHGEYRNRTRNGKWDLQARGELHTAGYNAGDYAAYASLERQISPRLGSLLIGFQNVNRSPSFLFDPRSSFYLDPDRTKDFGKENTTRFFGRIRSAPLGLELGADYFLVANYLYQAGYFTLQQEGALFNLLRIQALKTFRFGRFGRLHSEVYLQQKTGNAPVNVPLLFTRNRISIEGRFFRNLDLSTGLELRYHTPFRGDNYFPVNGQFAYQDSVTLANLPEVHAYLNFRIRTFKAYVRFENLNTARDLDGFGFTNNNLAAPLYPNPGLVFRLGIAWSFIN